MVTGDTPETFAVALNPGDCDVAGIPCSTWWENNLDGVVADEPAVTFGPGGCLTFGCTDTSACNYDPGASHNNGSCLYPEPANDCDGDCLSDADGDGLCDEFEVPGCTDPSACNYSTEATDDDGSCSMPGCMEQLPSSSVASVE